MELTNISEPDCKISIKAVNYWRITNIIVYSIILIVAFIVTIICYLNFWSTWLMYISIIFYILIIPMFILEAFIIPKYKQKYWRYKIDNNYIQLKFGGFFLKKHIVIPIDKVYYVNTVQHAILRRYNLTNIKIGTLANIHEIPAIDFIEGERLKKLLLLFHKK